MNCEVCRDSVPLLSRFPLDWKLICSEDEFLCGRCLSWAFRIFTGQQRVEGRDAKDCEQSQASVA